MSRCVIGLLLLYDFVGNNSMIWPLCELRAADSSLAFWVHFWQSPYHFWDRCSVMLMRSVQSSARICLDGWYELIERGRRWVYHKLKIMEHFAPKESEDKNYNGQTGREQAAKLHLLWDNPSSGSCRGNEDGAHPLSVISGHSRQWSFYSIIQL